MSKMCIDAINFLLSFSVKRNKRQFFEWFGLQYFTEKQAFDCVYLRSFTRAAHSTSDFASLTASDIFSILQES